MTTEQDAPEKQDDIKEPEKGSEDRLEFSENKRPQMLLTSSQIQAAQWIYWLMGPGLLTNQVAAWLLNSTQGREAEEALAFSVSGAWKSLRRPSWAMAIHRLQASPIEGQGEEALDRHSPEERIVAVLRDVAQIPWPRIQALVPLSREKIAGILGRARLRAAGNHGGDRVGHRLSDLVLFMDHQIGGASLARIQKHLASCRVCHELYLSVKEGWEIHRAIQLGEPSKSWAADIWTALKAREARLLAAKSRVRSFLAWPFEVPTGWFINSGIIILLALILTLGKGQKEAFLKWTAFEPEPETELLPGVEIYYTKR